MSYEIFTKLKYNPGTKCFDCASYSNNVWPKTPSKWTMDYYAKKYPDATDSEILALLILQGIWSGDKYCANIIWANEYKKIANMWMAERGEPENYQSIDAARELAKYYADYTKQPKKRYVLKNACGNYITKINKTSYNYGQFIAAKIFTARTQNEILEISGAKWLVEHAGYNVEQI